MCVLYVVCIVCDVCYMYVDAWQCMCLQRREEEVSAAVALRLAALRQGLSLNQKLAISARLTGQVAARIFLFLHTHTSLGT